MAPNALPEQRVLLQLLSYDPDTGQLRWKPRGEEWFKRRYHAETWNRRYAGQAAFTSANVCGYLTGSVLGQACMAHRVIWKMVTGEEPEQIDHVNHNRDDNRLCNLRGGDQALNQRNYPRRRDNKSGLAGVRWKPDTGKWYAHIGVNGKRVRLGEFDAKEDAIMARLAAERQHGYLPQHGKTLRSSKER